MLHPARTSRRYKPKGGSRVIPTDGLRSQPSGQEHERFAEKRRLRRFAIALVITSIAAGAIFTTIVVRVFTPPAVARSPEFIDLEIQANEPSTDKPILYVDFTQTGASYYAIFPQSLAGVKYMIGTTTGAALTGFTSVPYMQAMTEDDGQVFTGVVPKIGSPQASSVSVSAPSGCDSLFASTKPYFVELIVGRLRIEPSASWPYQRKNLPIATITYSTPAKPAVALGASTQVCQQLELPEGYDVVSTTPIPTLQLGDAAIWQGDQLAPEVLVRKDGAEGIANLSIILAGVAFAVTAGFLPMWVENRSRRHLFRR